MRRPVAFAAILSLAAVTFASCGGGSDAQLLPGATAREIEENLDRVRQYAAEGECIGAADAATEVRAQIEALQEVDAKLKRALQDGAEKLDQAVAGCEETTPETTTSEDETTKPEHAEPPGEEKKAEKEREKEEKALEKEEQKEEEDEEAPPSEGPPAETPPGTPGESGGPSGGVGPGEAVGPGGE